MRNEFVYKKPKDVMNIDLQIELSDVYHGFSKIIPISLKTDCECSMNCIHCDGNGCIIRQMKTQIFIQNITNKYIDSFNLKST